MKKGETLVDYFSYVVGYLYSCCLRNETFSKFVSKVSNQRDKKLSPICAIRSLPNTQIEREDRYSDLNDDCSYEEGYSDYTESESSSEAASFVPPDLFYDPSVEEYGYDNSHPTTSSTLRAQRSYLRKTNPLEYQQSVFDDNPLLAESFEYYPPDLFDIYTRSNVEMDLDGIKDDNEEYVAYNYDGTRSDCIYPSSLTITETEMQMYNLFKEKGLLGQNLIRKGTDIPETIQEVESLSEYDSDQSETSVTESNESVMTDLAGLFAESETEIPETKEVRAENAPFTILSRILLLVGQKFVKSKYFLQYIWLSFFTLSLILNPPTNIPVASMFIPVIYLYLPWVGQYCRQLIWRLWPKKPKKRVYLTPKTFSANLVRVCPTRSNRFNIRLTADYEKYLRMKKNLEKEKLLDSLRKVEKVEKENWKPPDPWVFANKVNNYVSDLESDIEEAYSSQGYIRERGRRRKRPEPSSPDYFPGLVQASPLFEIVKVDSNKLVSRTIVTRIPLVDLRYYIKIGFQDKVLRAGLIDTGSVGCCIGKHVVDKLRKVLKFKTVKTNSSMTGVNPKLIGNITERVYLDFILENNCIIRQVPFSVVDNDYDVILGHNFLNTYRYKMYWKGDAPFIKLGFSELVRIYIGELGSEVSLYPLNQDNVPKDNSVGVTNSENFVVSFREQDAFIESAPPYELIDPNSPSRIDRNVDSGWEGFSDCLSSLTQCICIILLLFGVAIVFSVYKSQIHSAVVLEHNKTVTCHTQTFYHPKNKTF